MLAHLVLVRPGYIPAAARAAGYTQTSTAPSVFPTPTSFPTTPSAPAAATGPAAPTVFTPTPPAAGTAGTASIPTPSVFTPSAPAAPLGGPAPSVFPAPASVGSAPPTMFTPSAPSQTPTPPTSHNSGSAPAPAAGKCHSRGHIPSIGNALVFLLTLLSFSGSPQASQGAYGLVWRDRHQVHCSH